MNLRPDSTASRICSLFAELGPMTSKEIADRVGLTLKTTATHLSRLRQRGYVRKLGDTQHRDGSRGRTYYVYALADWSGQPRVPRNLPIPAEWVVERDLVEPDRTVYEQTGPSPCFHCCHASKCRERVAALDDRPLPCFEGDE